MLSSRLNCTEIDVKWCKIVYSSDGKCKKKKMKKHTHWNQVSLWLQAFQEGYCAINTQITQQTAFDKTFKFLNKNYEDNYGLEGTICDN